MELFQDCQIVGYVDITHQRAHELLEEFFENERESGNVPHEIITNLKLLDQDLIYSSEHTIAHRKSVRVAPLVNPENWDEYEKEVSSDEEDEE